MNLPRDAKLSLIIMPNTPPKSKAPDASQDPSPAKAILATPPRAGCQLFFFRNPDGAKTAGFTPNGKRIIKLKRYEGEHHLWVRDPGAPHVIVDGDSPLPMLHKHKPEVGMLRLEALLANLKKRSDQDFKIFQEKGQVDEGHLQYAITSINECILQLKKCYKSAPNQKNFIDDLNARITQGKIYNPFGLKRIYLPLLGYQGDLATNPAIYQSHLDVTMIMPPPAKAAAEKRKSFGGLYDNLPAPKHSGESATDKENAEPVKLGAVFQS